MKSASVLSVLAAGTIAAISTSVCAGSNGTDAVMRSLNQVNRIYTPEKTTHTELLLRLNDLGCHYRVNNRMKADPEDVMKHTFGWFYRLLPDERGIANCFPVTVFFQNREDGRDVIEIDGGITLANAAEVYAAGCEVLVAGSTVFASENPEATIHELLNV